MTSVAIQVLPNVQDDEEVIRIVDEVIAYIKSTGLNCYVGPFETTIEGDYDQHWIYCVIGFCHGVRCTGRTGKGKRIVSDLCATVHCSYFAVGIYFK